MNTSKFAATKHICSCPHSQNGDDVHEYTKNFLSVGCIYLLFKDAIKEGDGIGMLPLIFMNL